MESKVITEEDKDALKAKFGRKKVITSTYTPLVPESPERELKRIYNIYFGLINRAVKARLPRIKKYYKSNIKNERFDGFGDMYVKMYMDIHEATEEVKSKAKKLRLNERIKKVAHQTKNHSSHQWSNATKQTLGDDIFKELYTEEFYERFVNQFILDALDYAKKMNAEYFTNLENRIVNAYKNRENITKLLRDIQKDLNSLRHKQGMIARDQIGTLNAMLMKAQCEKAGVESYIWKTEHDDRVRKSHKELDGKQFRFDNPPMMWYETTKGRVYTRRCNPGEDFRCRCIAVPVFDLRNL